jgi:hypothetical protein
MWIGGEWVNAQDGATFEPTSSPRSSRAISD